MLWENFLENFLSDVLTVVLFGGGTYLLFHKKINQKISQISNNNQNIVAQRIEKINGDKTSPFSLILSRRLNLQKEDIQYIIAVD